LPAEVSNSTHVYHQFTLQLKEKNRDDLKDFLASKGIASMVYYPMSLNNQKAFSSISRIGADLTNSEILASTVISLPMHTELTPGIQKTIADAVIEFFGK
jgi:dTDP-4-amino-4,6-dideoxygalactose transaminase